MPGLQPERMRIGLRRPAVARVHLGGVVGVVRAGAIDRRRPQHRRKQLRAAERRPSTLLLPALAAAAFSAPCAALPVVEDAEHGRVGRLAGELGGVEDLVVDDKAGAGSVGGLIGRELVAGHGRLLPCAVPIRIVAKGFAKSVGFVEWHERAEPSRRGAQPRRRPAFVRVPRARHNRENDVRARTVHDQAETRRTCHLRNEGHRATDRLLDRCGGPCACRRARRTAPSSPPKRGSWWSSSSRPTTHIAPGCRSRSRPIPISPSLPRRSPPTASRASCATISCPAWARC